MTTNPSTGLPEELEKIVQEMLAPILATEYFSAMEFSKIGNGLRAGVRKVIDDWAVQKVCWRCAEGIPLDRRGKYHIVTRDVFTTTTACAATCAASVLREGLK